MRSRARWRIAALIVLVFSALILVPSSRAQLARISKGTATPTASMATAGAPATQFSEAFVGPWANAGQIRYEAMAVDGQGNIVVAGSFVGQINFGGGNILSKGGLDIFIAKYSSNGAYLWSKGIGGSSDDWAKAVAVDPSGNILITSWSGSGTVDFGGGPVSLVAAYLAKYDPNGGYLWAKALGTNIADGTALDTDSSGNVIVSGYFTGPCDFGGGPISSVNSGDAFLAKYSPTGGYLWALRAGGSSAYGTQVGQVIVDHSDEIVMTGWTTGAGSMGGVSFQGLGNNDIFLVKYSATGVARWAKSLGGANQDRGRGVAIDSLNNIVLTGLLGDNATLGSGTLMGGGIFLAKYSPTGVTLWSENFPPPAGASITLENGNAVAVDSGDNIAITGAVVGDANLGGGLLPMTSGDYNNNTYLAEYTSAGSNIWSARFPNLIPTNYPGFNSGKGIGTEVDGSVILFGVFSDSINLGLGVLTNPGACGGSCGYGAYLARFGAVTSNPTPTPTWTPTPPAGTATKTPTPTPTPTPPNATRFYTVSPCRVIDTRNPDGPSGGPALAAGTTRTFPVAGLCGIPSAAKAVAINVAVFLPSDAGDLRLFPAGLSAPMASSVNFTSGVIRANNSVATLGSNGQVTVQCDMLSGATDFFADVYGYYR